jgi:hypothetical protein
MDPQNNLTVKTVPETTFQQQQQRRYISPAWRANGTERFAYQEALQSEMPVQDNNVLFSEQRFAPVGPLEEDYPVRGAGKKKP